MSAVMKILSFSVFIVLVGSTASSGGVWQVSTSSAITDHANPQAKGSLAAILTEIGDQSATIELPGSTTYPISSDLTIPAGVALRFQNGAVLSVAEKKTLTINGEIEAGARPIFVGKGRIAGEPNIRAVLPQWFGARADGKADDTEALQKAVDFACTSNVMLVDLGRGRYRLTRTLNCSNTREPGTIHRDGLRIVGNSFTTTRLIGDTGDHHAIIETSGSQWLEIDNITLTAGAENPSSVGLFTGCPKACPQSQNQVYHIAIFMCDAMQQNGGLGSIGIWNYAAEEHTYHSVYINANRPVVLWAFNGEKPDAPDAKGMFNYKNSHVQLLNLPHSLGVVTFSGECFLMAEGKHAPVVTSHCANSLAMHNTYMGSGAGKGDNTCAFDIHGSMTNLTYSGTIEGLATFARVNDLLIGSRVSVTYGLVGEAQRTGLLYGSTKGAMDGKACLLELGPNGRIENCDLTFSLAEQKERPLLGLLKPAKGKVPTAGIYNTTIKTNQDAKYLEMPAELRTHCVNTILSNPVTLIVVNERNAASK